MALRVVRKTRHPSLWILRCLLELLERITLDEIWRKAVNAGEELPKQVVLQPSAYADDHCARAWVDLFNNPICCDHGLYPPDQRRRHVRAG